MNKMNNYYPRGIFLYHDNVMYSHSNNNYELIFVLLSYSTDKRCNGGLGRTEMMYSL